MHVLHSYWLADNRTAIWTTVGTTIWCSFCTTIGWANINAD
jgi:hypothetical protein